MKLTNFLIIAAAAIFISSCGNQQNNNNKNNDNASQEKPYEASKITLLPSPNDKSKTGDVFKISVTLTDTLKIDSAALFINNGLIISQKQYPIEYQWDTKENKVGKNTIKAISYSKGKSYTTLFNLILLSDIQPQNQSYKIEKIYPHDVAAYTQGLVIDNGIMYESTGLTGQSTLRKVKYETGEVLQSFAIPNTMFGEGITIINDKIIQLTWRDQTGFVYDKSTFKLVNKFTYPTEGWGITTIDKKPVMSDGTHNLYFLDAENYSETSRIEVYDDKGSVQNLNELEYIDGAVYANIYTTDKIAKIDPKNGKVLSYIDLKGLLKEEDKKSDTDVLNGICWDKDKKKLFVTGKKWPKLFVIQII